MGRSRHAGIFQHDTVAGAHLCQRRRRANAVPGIRRNLRNVLCRSRREISGSARGDATAVVIEFTKNLFIWTAGSLRPEWRKPPAVLLRQDSPTLRAACRFRRELLEPACKAEFNHVA